MNAKPAAIPASPANVNSRREIVVLFFITATWSLRESDGTIIAADGGVNANELCREEKVNRYVE
jgi:hypothetical protein